MAASMLAARVVHCHLQPPREGQTSPESSAADQVKMTLQPRPWTLRSDHRRSGSGVVQKIMSTMIMKRRRRRSLVHDQDQEISDYHDGVLDDHAVEVELEEEDMELIPVLENLFESVERSNKIYYVEIIVGRIAMLVLAVIVGMELATGDSIFNKVDFEALAEGVVGCLTAATCATFFANSSHARKKVGRIFSDSFYTFLDTLIDNIVDGLFLENDSDDGNGPPSNNFN